MSAKLWKRAAKRFWQNWGHCSKLALTAQQDTERHIADLTREWSAHEMTRRELAASRAAHEKAMAERDHLRKQIRIAVRKLEQDLEFGERSAYVEEALELLR